jgi:nicotinate phosphoribosyltransferase
MTAENDQQTPPDLPTQSLLIPQDGAALATDLYQLTMMAAYWQTGQQSGRRPRATFEAFVRKLPAGRGALLLAGVEQVLDYLLRVRFTGADIDWLRSLEQFAAVKPGFWEYLREFRFRGDAWAMPEGTVFFPDEPVLRITADIPEAQLPETWLLSVLNIQTLAATKAARVVQAAAGRPVLEFGLRRAHGPQAGVYATRGAYVGGVSATSDVFAARALGIPAAGTMAHAWIQAHDDESAAFRDFAGVFPRHTTALVDTYDTVTGAARAAKLGPALAAVRLDSGDLADLSVKVRRILREGGAGHAKIVASNDLNEYSVAALVAGGAEIDVFGVGTDLVVSRDAPALSFVYKLVETVEPDGRTVPRVKLSAGKSNWPTAKQVWRRTGPDGRFAGDTLAGPGEAPGGEPLLQKVIENGRLIAPPPRLSEIRARAAAQWAALPPDVARLEGPAAYPVTPSEALRQLQRQLAAQRGSRE